ncbi:ComEC family competence protein [Ensifer adhaerens]|uniref:ComEC/Rec2 family competence protein n=1 Tax=Ensifer adhaerens TaxID=106592 RepID=UPI001CC02C13|nr:ComEC/Rec2 family competence protein [Ensifer adhaerens]MBZ7921422.1 ComEC family competence protein [Ensifer adhaerens]UAX93848.1 ComEC family competence protein [Ensifer adhaerens]UAY01484.1 ComEC family competence protein [Ensifer adhaerens]UAY08867.1 ComEC family competence protein [Ensifer adhaerens]
MSDTDTRQASHDAERGSFMLPGSDAATAVAVFAPNVPRSLMSTQVRRGISRLSAHLSPRTIKASIASAIEEERAYGHGFVLIPVLLIFGVLTWLSLPFDVGIVKLALLLCIFSMAAVVCIGKFARLRAPLIAAALFTAGMLLIAVDTVRTDTVVLDAPVTTNVRGVVFSREQDDKGQWRYGVDVQQTTEPRLRRQPTKVTLVARGREDPLPIGATIEGRARLSPPSGPALPGLNDFAFDSYFKGIGAVGFFYGAPKGGEALATGETKASSPSSLATRIASMREAVGERIRAAIGGDTGALAAALVTAEERAISRETVEVLRQSGLAHVLAISGLNMALAAGTFLIGARTVLSMIPGLAHRVAIKKLAASGALLMVCTYILISGGAVSALRAWIMISIMLMAVFFDRMSISLRNVALAAIIIVAITPSAVAGPGFQMSFAATLALVAGYARWRERRETAMPAAERQRKGRGLVTGVIAGVVITSLIGGLATSVYSIAYFHRLPAYGLLANVLTMPVISIVIMPFGLFAMLLMPFGLEHYPLLAMAWGLDRMLDIARFVVTLDGEIVTGRIGHLGFVLIAAGGVLICVLRSWLALSGAVLIFAGLVSLPLERDHLPDVMISEDGRLIGLVANDAIATNRVRPSDFVFSQWQRALAVENHLKPAMLPLPEAGDPYPATEPAGKSAPPLDQEKVTAIRADLSSAIEASAAGVFVCREKQWCAARNAYGWTIVALENPRLFPALCDQADLVVTAARVDSAKCPTARARIVNAQTLRRTGAIEVRAQPDAGQTAAGMQFRTSFTALSRPWERHRAYDWRTGSFAEGQPAL